MRARDARPAGSWYAPVGSQPATPAVRLICFAHAGGSDMAFLPWGRMVPAGVAVWAAAFPGRGRRFREQPVTDWPVLVSSLAAALAAPGPPFVLFGHSLGALVAYEVTRELQRRGAPLPRRLIVAGSNPPPVVADARLPEPGTDGELIELVRALGGTPEDVLAEPELLELFLPVLRADFTLLARYRCAPSEPLRCALAVYLGAQDPETSSGTGAGWAALTNGSVIERTFTGGHFFVAEQASNVVPVVLEDAGLAAPVGGT